MITSEVIGLNRIDCEKCNLRNINLIKRKRKNEGMCVNYYSYN